MLSTGQTALPCHQMLKAKMIFHVFIRTGTHVCQDTYKNRFFLAQKRFPVTICANRLGLYSQYGQCLHSGSRLIVDPYSAM